MLFEGFVVLVCGGRDYRDREAVFEVLDEIHAACTVSLLVSGSARGADALGEMWARVREIPYLGVPARWTTEGKAAGPRRNDRMLKMLPRLDLVVHFPGGNGTAHMVRRARAAGVSTWKAVE